jgi:hypothetical protein
MIKLFIPVIFLSLLLNACNNHRKVPADVISRQDMIGVLWDMMRADQFVTSFVIKDTSLNRIQESTRLYNDVFRIHHTDKAQFAKSIKFYKNNPDLFKPILDSLEKRKGRIMQESYNSVAHDSLKFRKRPAAE